MQGPSDARRDIESSSVNKHDRRDGAHRHCGCIPALLPVFVFPALGGLLYGADIGATTFVLSSLQSEHAGVAWASKVADSDLLKGFFTSSGVGGALMGTLMLYRFADLVGRRKELIMSAVLYVVGAVLECVSSVGLLAHTTTTGLVVALIGRWIYGIACGLATHAAPAYLGEMSPPNVRGRMVAGKEAFAVLGIFIGQVVGYVFVNISGGWRWAYGVNVPIALIMLAGMLAMPRSARWLALHQRMDEAKDSLRYIMSEDAAEEAMKEINTQAEITRKRQARDKTAVKPRLFSRRYGWQLVAGLGVVIFQQITGQPTVLYYVNEIFKEASLPDSYTLFIGAFKFLGTIATIMTVDRCGRRTPLIVGTVLMLGALLALSCLFYEYDPTSQPGLSPHKAGIIAAMFVYIGGYQVGFGPITWLLLSEIFPLEVRGQAVALAISCNFLFNLLVSLIFPALQGSIGTSPTFALFSSITAVAIVFIYFNIPETKQRTLESIEKCAPAALPQQPGCLGVGNGCLGGCGAEETEEEEKAEP